jgi:hypothetical protein
MYTSLASNSLCSQGGSELLILLLPACSVQNTGISKIAPGMFESFNKALQFSLSLSLSKGPSIPSTQFILIYYVPCCSDTKAYKQLFNINYIQ